MGAFGAAFSLTGFIVSMWFVSEGCTYTTTFTTALLIVFGIFLASLVAYKQSHIKGSSPDDSKAAHAKAI